MRGFPSPVVMGVVVGSAGRITVEESGVSFLRSAFDSDGGEAHLQGLVLFLPLRGSARLNSSLTSRTAASMPSRATTSDARILSTWSSSSRWLLAIEPGKLAQRVLDLLAVPDLASPAQVVEIAALGHTFDEGPEAREDVHGSSAEC